MLQYGLMNVLKGLGTGILSFLLFISLSIFGIAFLLQSTLLNPDFIVSELDKLDITAVSREVVDEEFEDELPPEADFMKEAIYKVLAQEEPWIKEQADQIIHTSYDYILGKTNELVITIPLKEEKAKLKGLLWDALKKDIPEWLPEIVGDDLKPFINENLEKYIDNIPRELLPFGDEFTDEQLREYLQQYLQETDAKIEAGNIPELEGLLEALVRPYYDKHYDELAAEIPDDGIITGEDIPTDTMEALETARHYIGVFKAWYYVLIGIMVLLIAGIILINRNVKVITRTLGIDFAVYGVLEFAGILIARTIDFTGMTSDLPNSLETWVTEFFRDFLLPLQWFSLGILIAGIVLIVVSFLYKRGAVETTEPVEGT